MTSAVAENVACTRPSSDSKYALGQVDLDITVALPTPWRLDHGVVEKSVSVNVRLVGPQDAPVVMVLGGISANRYACDAPLQGQLGWWRDLVGCEGYLDSREFRILSFEFFGGECEGVVTTADQARIAKVICQHLGIQKLHAFLGASYGGMIALQFGALFPELVQNLIVVCAAHRPHPMGIAWRSIQRKIVQLGVETRQPNRALSLARELGMTTYRTPEEFGQRFALNTAPNEPNRFEVESYLETRGQAFIGKMTPERYLALSKSIDLHVVDPTSIPVPTTLVAFNRDQLVPIEEVRVLRDQLPKLNHYFEKDSIFGHDAFLKEIPILACALQQTLHEYHS